MIEYRQDRPERLYRVTFPNGGEHILYAADPEEARTLVYDYESWNRHIERKWINVIEMLPSFHQAREVQA